MSVAPRFAGWLRHSVRWQILALLFLVSFIAYIFRLNLSVAGQAIKTDLGLNDIQLGWVLSSFIWGYALFQFPGGLFGQYVGPRRALTVLVAGWAFITLLSGLLPMVVAGSTTAVIVVLVALRFMMGVIQAPLFPVVAGTIANWFPVSRWALPNGLTSMGLGLGAAATPPVIAWLMSNLGWRESFYLTAPLGLLVAVMWWFASRDEPSQHPRVLPEELALIRPEPKPTDSVETRDIWKKILTNREILLLASSYLCMNYVFYIFFSWFFIYLIDVRGFGVLESGFLASLPFIVGSLAAAAGGEACDGWCRRFGPNLGCRLPGVLGMGGAAALLFAGARADSPYWAIGLLSVCFACTQFTEGAYWSATTFVSRRYAAGATGVLNTGGNLGGVISTPLIPILVHHFGWFVALGTGSLFAVLGAALWMFVRVDWPIRIES